MPVMNYTREHKVYPVTFEVFPAIEGEKAEFSLYEDDGENLGYLRGEYLRTPVSCATSAQGYEIEIGEREGSVYKIEGEREFIFRIYTDRLPKTVLLDGVKAKKGKTWTADKKEGICEFHIADDGKKHNVKFVF
jgi:alpha-glucosidase